MALSTLLSRVVFYVPFTWGTKYLPQVLNYLTEPRESYCKHNATRKHLNFVILNFPPNFHSGNGTSATECRALHTGNPQTLWKSDVTPDKYKIAWILCTRMAYKWIYSSFLDISVGTQNTLQAGWPRNQGLIPVRPRRPTQLHMLTSL
jgi:hypothetical protein